MSDPSTCSASLTTPTTPTFTFSPTYYHDELYPTTSHFYQIVLSPPKFILPLLRLPSTFSSYQLQFKLTAGSPCLPNAKLVIFPFTSLNPATWKSLQKETEWKPFLEAHLKQDQVHIIPFNYNGIGHAIAEITLPSPGPYEYFVSFTPTPTPTTMITHPTPSSVETTRAFSTSHLQHTDRGCILMDPRLPFSSTSLIPNLDALVLQTVVPKWLGPFKNWSTTFSTLHQLGFNMIHFVPFQKRGASNSPYSLTDFLDIHDDIFDSPTEHLTKEKRRHLLQSYLNELHSKYHLLSLTDMVFNHCAFDSPWLLDHPECGYNLINSTHLIPAFELDEAILEFSMDSEQSNSGIGKELQHEQEIQTVLTQFREKKLIPLKLWEYFILNVEMHVHQFKTTFPNSLALDNHQPTFFTPSEEINLKSLTFDQQIDWLKKNTLQQVPFGQQRFPKSLHFEKSIALLLLCYPNLESTHLLNVWERWLNALNLDGYQLYDQVILKIMGNLSSTLKWQRLDPLGPKLGPITSQRPMVETYFTRGYTRYLTSSTSSSSSSTSTTATASTTAIRSEKSMFPWVNPNLVWANNGWIWNASPCLDFASNQSMAYLQRDVIVWGDCVKLRYGMNENENPWLWKYMRTYAREMASMFHGFRLDNCHSTPLHVAKDLLFHARQINPQLYIIAELFTGDPGIDRLYVTELGIHSLIREAMQAWDARELARLIHRYSGDPIGSFEPILKPGKPIPLKPKEPHAILMDCTHDNEPPSVKRQVSDTLSNAALVSFARCAVGSVLGYDLCIPKQSNIVTEHRKYPPLNMDLGIHRCREKLSEMNQCMVPMKDIYVHHEEPYILVARQHPRTHEGITLIALPAFKSTQVGQGPLTPIVLSRSEAQLCLAQRIQLKQDPFLDPSTSPFICGYPIDLIDTASNITLTQQDQDQLIHVNPSTLPGSIFIFQTRLRASQELLPLQALHQGPPASLLQACDQLSLLDLGHLLFRCKGETSLDVYVIPGYGPVSYCGLEGIATVLRPLIQHNDLGHALCNNLREGLWLLDYTLNRFPSSSSSSSSSLSISFVKEWTLSMWQLIQQIPNYLVPKYFALVFMCLVKALRQAAWNHMKSNWKYNSSFVRRLALTSIQLVAMPPGVSLHPTQLMPSLAAGLPHFALDYMRCWGRDIFISLKGLFLLTGQFDLAKSHLLAFASVLRHGLIPNLLDSGRRPRYNARDAVWWFLHSLKAYVEWSPEKEAILFTKVKRRFPQDTWIPWDHPECYQKESTVLDIVVEILQRHAQGIDFIEWDAGPNLDHAMTKEGFHIRIRLDPLTGFCFGGNGWNCGTWMDKMGDFGSVHGIPATPRDGAPIELTALVYETVTWLQSLVLASKIQVKGVTTSFGFLSWEQWSQKIASSFETYYFILNKTKEPASVFEGIYKDVLGSSRVGADVQFRPNQFIAMAIAPDLFDSTHAQQALTQGLQLLGPLGMKTLHPKDPQYRPNYDPSHAGPDLSLAHGYNYHQGPEWVWPVGYFFMAYLHFHQPELHWIQTKLIRHALHIKTSLWAGLPELTNENGAPCPGSCESQAWSSATLLELTYAMEQAVKL